MAAPTSPELKKRREKFAAKKGIAPKAPQHKKKEHSREGKSSPFPKRPNFIKKRGSALEGEVGKGIKGAPNMDSEKTFQSNHVRKPGKGGRVHFTHYTRTVSTCNG